MSRAASSRGRKVARAILLLLLNVGVLPCAVARGNKEQPMEKASGLENWEQTFDISTRPAGKYNIVIEGSDAAGNTAIAGPFNVYVDPDSDLPLVSLVNPLPFMRVGGDLNVVGTCVDDDGVARVEISIDGGDWQTAEGTEFWSLAVPTAPLHDGRLSLAARGVDINGVVGPETKLLFDLDRAKPAASLSLPVPGTLVAGALRLEGSVSDANGLRSLELSTDGGKTFLPVELKRGKDPTIASFSSPLDTRKFSDGPLVLWMRSVDGVGSKGSAAFLLVVDNTKPLIEIARPAPNQAVNGRFSVAGAVRDAVGVKRLGYSFGGESGEIPLVPGNPFFVKEFDALPLKSDKAEVVLVAEDNIGNLTRLVLNPKIDREADKPRVKLAFPRPDGLAAGERAHPGELVWGSIEDDDGVSALRYAFDGGAPVEMPAAEVFSFVLPDLASGNHKLSLTAVDSLGTAGNPTVVPFIMDRGEPAFVFERLVKAPGTAAEVARDFHQGAEVRVDGGEFLEGVLASPNPPASAEYAISGGAAKKLELQKDSEAGRWRFRLPLDRSLPYGFATVDVKTLDAFGNEGRGRALFYVVNYGVIREDPGFVFDDPRIAEDGRVVLSEAEPLFGAFYREELESLSLDPPTDIVEASFAGSTVTIAPRREGLSAPTRLVAKTVKGREYSAGPFIFQTDATAPAIELATPREGSFLAGDLLIEGRVDDAGGIDSLSYRLGPTAEPKSLSRAEDGGFQLSVPGSELSPGAGIIIIEAVDASGNRNSLARSFFFDADPPEARFLSPPPGAEVSGPEDVAVLVADASGLASVEYAEDGSSFGPLDFQSGFFVHRADFALHPDAAYRLTDRAGNAALIHPDVSVVPRPARPLISNELGVEPGEEELKIELAGAAGGRKLSVLLPALSEAGFGELDFGGEALPERFSTRLLLSGAVSLKGQASGSAPLKRVSLSQDGGGEYAVLAEFKDDKSAKPILPFAFAVDSLNLADGPGLFILKVEDLAGGVYLCPLPILVDTAPPVATVLYPEEATATTSGALPLVLTITDDHALAQAELALGAEKTPLPLEEGSTYFVRVLDPSAVKGAQLVGTVSVRDAAGSAGAAAFKIAYAASGDIPALTIEQPEGALLPGSILRAGATDDDGPATLSLAIDGAPVLESAAGILGYVLPGLAAGKHSLLLSAEDGTGHRSELKRDFQVLGPAPRLASILIGPAQAQLAWEPGIGLAADLPLTLSGTLEAPNGFTSLEASMEGFPPLKVSLGKAVAPGAPLPFSIALPAALPHERLSLELLARDGAGLETRRRYDLHPLLPALPTNPPADDAEGLRFSGLGAEDSAEKRLAPGETIEGRFNGRPLASIALEPPTSCLEASFEGQELLITAREEGRAESLRIIATTVDGDRFECGPCTLNVDAENPELELAAPSDGVWVGSTLEIKGQARDPAGIAELAYAVNDGDWTALDPDVSASSANAQGTGDRPAGTVYFSVELALADYPEGGVRLDLRARDAAGRETGLSRFIIKDSIPPALSQILPLPGEAVNGTTTFVGEAIDQGRLSSLDFLPAPDAAVEEVSGDRVFSRTLDLARLGLPLPGGGGFLVVDRAGNHSLLAPELKVDLEADKPRVDIQAPAELEVLRADFTISGLALDDDGIAAVYLRIDGGEWRRLDISGTSFTLPVALSETTDNEHLVEAYAEDIYGVTGEVASRRYRISKEEPVARMLEPSISRPHRGLVELSGTASDANGIASGTVSFDNSTSFNTIIGAESWSYPLDTRILTDGLHPLAIRPLDSYETEGFYASMITVDNTPPEATLDLPEDGSSQARELLVSGRVSDNLALEAVRVELLRAGATPEVPVLSEELGTGTIVRKTLDISSLPPGDYTVRLIARDRADNECLASRDIAVLGAKPADSLDIYYPVEGAALADRLVVTGRANVSGGAGSIEILVDGQRWDRTDPDGLGNFSLGLDTTELSEGRHRISARTLAPDGSLVQAREFSLSWRRFGPWVAIDSPAPGTYLPYRPFLEGRAGWTAEAPLPEADRETLKATRRLAETRKVSLVEVSLDGGQSFLPAEGKESWRFRLETQDYKEGSLHAIVRARYVEGSSAQDAIIYALDKTPPTVGILSPDENGRFNGEIRVSGFASDESGLGSVSAALRSGDKKSYELPAFIQGLYLDAQALGATYYDVGIGLTFFQDNVKLQVQYGYAPEDGPGYGRFGGTVFGAKLLANLAYLPASFLFGPDWDFLSASFALGANFSFFSTSTSGEGRILGAVVGQLEFPKLTFRNLSAFRKYSLYTEGQVWFISSDVVDDQSESPTVVKLSFGARIGLF